MNLSETDRRILEDQRADFWGWVAKVAAGVFVGNIAFALTAYFVMRIWIEQAL